MGASCSKFGIGFIFLNFMNSLDPDDCDVATKKGEPTSLFDLVTKNFSSTSLTKYEYPQPLEKTTVCSVMEFLSFPTVTEFTLSYNNIKFRLMFHITLRQYYNYGIHLKFISATLDNNLIINIEDKSRLQKNVPVGILFKYHYPTTHANYFCPISTWKTHSIVKHEKSESLILTDTSTASALSPSSSVFIDGYTPNNTQSYFYKYIYNEEDIQAIYPFKDGTSIQTLLSGCLEGNILFKAKRKMKLATFTVDTAYISDKQCACSCKSPIHVYCNAVDDGRPVGTVHICLYFDHYKIIRQAYTYLYRDKKLYDTTTIYRQISSMVGNNSPFKHPHYKCYESLIKRLSQIISTNEITRSPDLSCIYPIILDVLKELLYNKCTMELSLQQAISMFMKIFYYIKESMERYKEYEILRHLCIKIFTVILQHFEFNYLYKSLDIFKDISVSLIQEVLNMYIYLIKLTAEMAQNENVEDMKMLGMLYVSLLYRVPYFNEYIQTEVTNRIEGMYEEQTIIIDGKVTKDERSSKIRKQEHSILFSESINESEESNGDTPSLLTVSHLNMVITDTEVFSKKALTILIDKAYNLSDNRDFETKIAEIIQSYPILVDCIVEIHDLLYVVIIEWIKQAYVVSYPSSPIFRQLPFFKCIVLLLKRSIIETNILTATPIYMDIYKNLYLSTDLTRILLKEICIPAVVKPMFYLKYIQPSQVQLMISEMNTVPDLYSLSIQRFLSLSYQLFYPLIYNLSCPMQCFKTDQKENILLESYLNSQGNASYQNSNGCISPENQDSHGNAGYSYDDSVTCDPQTCANNGYTGNTIHDQSIKNNHIMNSPNSCSVSIDSFSTNGSASSPSTSSSPLSPESELPTIFLARQLYSLDYYMKNKETGKVIYIDERFNKNITYIQAEICPWMKDFLYANINSNNIQLVLLSLSLFDIFMDYKDISYQNILLSHLLSNLPFLLTHYNVNIRINTYRVLFKVLGSSYINQLYKLYKEKSNTDQSIKMINNCIINHMRYNYNRGDSGIMMGSHVNYTNQDSPIDMPEIGLNIDSETNSSKKLKRKTSINANSPLENAYNRGNIQQWPSSLSNISVLSAINDSFVAINNDSFYSENPLTNASTTPSIHDKLNLQDPESVDKEKNENLVMLLQLATKSIIERFTVIEYFYLRYVNDRYKSLSIPTLTQLKEFSFYKEYKLLKKAGSQSRDYLSYLKNLKRASLLMFSTKIEDTYKNDMIQNINDYFYYLPPIKENELNYYIHSLADLLLIYEEYLYNCKKGHPFPPLVSPGDSLKSINYSFQDNITYSF
ncbi:hypothetical protein WA158_007095 [Blastocystis sp. Blastoise]